MIVRRSLRIVSIIRFTWRSNVFFLGVALLAAALYWGAGVRSVAIPLAAAAPLGAALAIFLAFRNSSAYDRWWEARKLWGRLVNESRNFTRQVLTFTAASPEEDDELASFRRELVYRHIAYVHGLRLHLRKQTQDCAKTLERWVPNGELPAYEASSNLPASVSMRQGERIRDAYTRGWIDDFRHMQLDSTMNKLLDIQGGCERIKGTPLPRQYDYFPQVFLYVYAFYLPFGLVASFGWFTAFISVPISFVFLVLQAAGRVNEDPFENRWTDTPMSTLSRMIEVNLREFLGETDLPPPIELVDGVAY
ncbi:MAG: bestrophin family ion channel [Myxococcota bacterium]